jgi:hypothetical protein
MPKFKVNDHIVCTSVKDNQWPEASWVFEENEEFIITSVGKLEYTLTCVKCAGSCNSGVKVKTYNLDHICELLGGGSRSSTRYFPNLSHV